MAYDKYKATEEGSAEHGVISSTPTGEDRCTVQGQTPQEFHFSKGKMIGRITYKRTNTTVIVHPTALEINKEVKKIFRKPQTEHLQFSLDAIEAASIRTVLDFWDTLYAILFGILGLFQPISFLMTAVCLWCAYGKEVEILTKDGNKIKIPLARSKSEANTLLSILAN